MAGYFSVPMQSPVVIFRHTEVTPILSRMKIPGLALLLLVSCLAGYPSQSACAQNERANENRKVINKVVPMYPVLARHMNLMGTVRLAVLVSADGNVKSIQVKGGSPLLVQSAQDAVHNWRWEKADHESTELIEFHFNP